MISIICFYLWQPTLSCGTCICNHQGEQCPWAECTCCADPVLLGWLCRLETCAWKEKNTKWVFLACDGLGTEKSSNGSSNELYHPITVTECRNLRIVKQFDVIKVNSGSTITVSGYMRWSFILLWITYPFGVSLMPRGTQLYPWRQQDQNST